MTQTHKLVPIEPTEEMMLAGLDMLEKTSLNPMLKGIYQAMLASAPEVGEAGTDKIERNYVYEDGIEPGYDKEPAVILALRNTELQKRVEKLEDLLSSAYNIANRNGEDTHWLRFAAQLHVHGISPITAKTFKILPSDENYQPDRTAQLEAERDSYKSALEAALDEKAQAKHDETVAVKLLYKEKDKVKRLVEATKQYIGWTDGLSMSEEGYESCSLLRAILAEMEAKG